jgi:hypothetical protein
LTGWSKIEKRLHARFDSLWIRGEWFRAAPVLLDFIASLTSLPMKTRRGKPYGGKSAAFRRRGLDKAAIAHASGSYREIAKRFGCSAPYVC